MISVDGGSAALDFHVSRRYKLSVVMDSSTLNLVAALVTLFAAFVPLFKKIQKTRAAPF